MKEDKIERNINLKERRFPKHVKTNASKKYITKNIVFNVELWHIFNSLGFFQVPIASLKGNRLAASHQITQSLAVLRKKIKL
jgi:hypothetical protein